MERLAGVVSINTAELRSVYLVLLHGIGSIGENVLYVWILYPIYNP